MHRDYISQIISRLQLNELPKVLMSIEHDVRPSEDDLRRRIMDMLSFRETSSQTLEQTMIQVMKAAKFQKPLLQSPNPVALHDEEYLPRDLKVVLNDQECKLPPYALSKKNANEQWQWRISVPINLNKYIKFDCRARNKLTVTCSDPDTYIVGVFVAEKLTWEDVIEKVRKRPFRTIKTSKEFIKNMMDSEVDIVINSLVVTLNDPLTTTRMTLPARGVECKHIQCFDAMKFLKINENMQTWKCPICRGKLRFENIEIDGSILSEECEEIILFKDGTWIEKKPYSNSNNNYSNDKGDHLKLKRLKRSPEKEFFENYNAIIDPTFNNNEL
ncbi:E3 SUMO-protein ligase PIAS3-like [Aphis craccivora]|uniref:E3 SUMO-protein ligase PIAS3-like n=1 Tax=Aphis craccivora TaxID=307492 RepID=A0A6G0XPN0_APHCR|nr:E3 SUMO-protein ligase PIAS3-like [Aphis craccivora]